MTTTDDALSRTSPAGARSPLPDGLAGARVLVIGGGSGWGAAAVRQLADLGATVTVVGRSGVVPDGVAGSSAVRALSADFRDEAALRRVAETVGEVDHVLVTAATVLGGPVTATPYAAVGDTVAGWLQGSYQVAHVFGSRITRAGSLTFTSGISTLRPRPGSAAAAAAGAGIEALGRVLAVELAPVRVNTVRPGGIDSALFRRLAGDIDDATVAAIGATLPAGRLARPEEVAAAAVFLMANPYLSGQVLGVDAAAALV